MDLFSYVANAHPEYIESLYQDFKNGNEDLDDEWKSFFQGFDFATTHANGEAGQAEGTASAKEFKVYALIDDYRRKAHLLSDTNPIRQRKNRHPHLKLNDFGLEEADLNQSFSVGSLIGLENACN